jgi:hypothetical protein
VNKPTYQPALHNPLMGTAQGGGNGITPLYQDETW